MKRALQRIKKLLLGSPDQAHVGRIAASALKALALGFVLSGCSNYDTSVSVGYQDVHAKITIKPAKGSK